MLLVGNGSWGGGVGDVVRREGEGVGEGGGRGCG